MEMDYLKGKEVKEILKITDQTLKRWRNSGKIKAKQISSNKFLYPKAEIQRLLGESSFTPENLKKSPAIYCRVSTTNQKDDLKRQKQLLLDYCNSQGFIIEDGYIFEEIASGMNEQRKEFWKLVKSVIQGKISHVFVTYKDRFSRFGFHYFEQLFQEFDCQIVTLNNMGNEESFEKELTDDLISIVHHFSMKMYSSRRKKLKSFEKELSGKEETEDV